MANKTIFEKIIAGEVPSHTIHENENVFAFLDADPVNPGHTLVVPKEPYKNMYKIPRDEFETLLGTVHTLVPKIKAAVEADGINIGINNEPAAGQEVMHLHVHIMPRFESDTFQHWQGEDDYHDNQDGERIAKKIRTALKN